MNQKEILDVLKSIRSIKFDEEILVQFDGSDEWFSASEFQDFSFTKKLILLIDNFLV